MLRFLLRLCPEWAWSVGDFVDRLSSTSSISVLLKIGVTLLFRRSDAGLYCRLASCIHVTIIQP